MILHSTEDWSIGEANGATRPEVNANLQKWITGPKSPGLIILEHELSNDTVGAFIQAFPLIAQNGWKFESVARLDGGSVYQNAPDSIGAVTPGEVAVAVSVSASAPASSGSASPSGNNNNVASSSGSKSSASSTSSGAAQASGTAAGDSSSALAFASPMSATIVACLSVLGAAFALS